MAAMVHPAKHIYGVQFHPEVTHSEFGQRILENFVRRVCRCNSDWKPSSAETIKAIEADIRARVGPSRNVLFFVSGGVDSSVAYKLCADALGQERVHGVYVDTGFMRKNESAEVMAAYEKAGFRNVRLRDASTEFLAAVGRETNPEIKRKRIGVAFLAVENDVLEHLPAGDWLLGQEPSIQYDRVRRHARVGPPQDHHTVCPSCFAESKLARSSSRSCILQG